LTSFIHGIGHFSVNPLVASYAINLGASALIVGMLTGLFFGVALSMRPVAGPVITKFDKRKLMIMVFAIGGVANIGYALFHNISAFILFRFFHGIQYSLFGTLTMTLAGDSLPKEKMASGMGYYMLCASVGMAIGPNIGIPLLSFGTDLINESFGFTCVFLFAMMSSFVGVIPSYILLPDKKTKQDILSTGAWYKNIASVHAVPISIVMFLSFVGWSLYNIYIFEFAKELEISGISTFYAVLAMGLMITRPASGWLTDRFGLAKVPPLAMVLFALSFLIVGFGKSIGPMLVGAAIASVGFGAFQPALFSMCILSETPLKRSVASNTLYIGIDLGLFLGPIMGGIVYDMYNYSVMFKTASLMIFLALIIFILMLPAYYRRRGVLEAMETE
jgi:MFS family permease